MPTNIGSFDDSMAASSSESAVWPPT
jgi:hypothetical protein